MNQLLGFLMVAFGLGATASADTTHVDHVSMIKTLVSYDLIKIGTMIEKIESLPSDVSGFCFQRGALDTDLTIQNLFIDMRAPGEFGSEEQFILKTHRKIGEVNARLKAFCDSKPESSIGALAALLSVSRMMLAVYTRVAPIDEIRQFVRNESTTVAAFERNDLHNSRIMEASR